MLDAIADRCNPQQLLSLLRSVTCDGTRFVLQEKTYVRFGRSSLAHGWAFVGGRLHLECCLFVFKSDCTTNDTAIAAIWRYCEVYEIYRLRCRAFSFRAVFFRFFFYSIYRFYARSYAVHFNKIEVTTGFGVPSLRVLIRNGEIQLPVEESISKQSRIPIDNIVHKGINGGSVRMWQTDALVLLTADNMRSARTTKNKVNGLK